MKYLDKKYINEIVCNSLNINKEEIKKIVSMGGMTNRNFKVFIKDTWYALRIPTPGTGDMINRKEEYNNIIYANKIGLDFGLIYFNKGTRVKISKFIENSEALNLNSFKKIENIEIVCFILRKLHTSKEKMKNIFDIYSKIELYEKLSNLKTYFKGNVEDKYTKRILINKIYQDFLWSIWTTIKEANGDYFGQYGINRYNRAKENLKKVFELMV